jgi:hypothetical protein
MLQIVRRPIKICCLLYNCFQITVSVQGRSKPFKACVQHLCVMADCALLRVKDDASSFEELVPAVPLLQDNSLPHLHDKLQVCVCVCVCVCGCAEHNI